MQMPSPAAAATTKAISEIDKVTIRPCKSGLASARIVLVRNSMSGVPGPAREASGHAGQDDDQKEKRHGRTGVDRQRPHFLLNDETNLIHDVWNSDHRYQ